MSETHGPKFKQGYCKHIVIDVDEAEEMAKALKVSALGFRSPRAKELLSNLARLLRDTEPEPIF